MRKKTHLPSSYSRDDENEGEGDHGKGDQDPDFQQVIGPGSLVLAVDGGQRLGTERISHLLSPSLEEAPSKV